MSFSTLVISQAVLMFAWKHQLMPEIVFWVMASLCLSCYFWTVYQEKQWQNQSWNWLIGQMKNYLSLEELVNQLNQEFQIIIKISDFSFNKRSFKLETDRGIKFLNFNSRKSKVFAQKLVQIYPCLEMFKSNKFQLEQQAKLSALGEIAAGIAHEINNPLAIVHGKAQMISFQIQESIEENQEINLKELEQNTVDIIDTINRVDKIVNSLKYFVRDDSRNPFTDTPVMEILDHVQVLSIDRCKKNGVKVSIVNSLPSGQTVWCKPTQISQALINLVNNSFDAIQGLDNKWIEIKTYLKDHDIVFEVADSGEGIDPQIRENLLKNFYTNKVTTKSSGTGIGLSIVKRIVEQHQGVISLVPEASNTTFRIKIPVGAKV